MAIWVCNATLAEQKTHPQTQDVLATASDTSINVAANERARLERRMEGLGAEAMPAMGRGCILVHRYASTLVDRTSCWPEHSAYVNVDMTSGRIWRRFSVGLEGSRRIKRRILQ